MKSKPHTALLDPSQQDQALRDLMPIIDWLTNYDSAWNDGARYIAMDHLAEAIKAFRHMDPRSPSIKAYLRWLNENTLAEEEKSNERK